MYNSPELILDQELTFLSYKQGVNCEFTVDEILDSPLWVTDNTNGIIKAIPLLNADNIVSSNPDDIVLDNKCVILQDNENTIISLVTDDVGSIHFHSLQLYAFAPYTVLDVVDEVTVYCIVCDEYLNTLNNVEVNVLIDSEVVATVKTDNQGIARYKVSEPCTVSFCYNGTDLSNSVMISGGE